LIGKGVKKMIDRLLVFTVFLTLFLSSCGKSSNTTSAGAPTPIPQNTNYPLTGQLPVIVDFNDFKSRVISGQFAPLNYSNVTIYLRQYQGSSVNQNCKTYLGGLVKICTSTSTTSSSDYIARFGSSTGQIAHEFGTTREMLLAQFTAIANFGTPGNRISQTLWEIRTAAGDIYGFDISYPLVANPVYSKKIDGTGYILNNWVGY
jgi:hypothetical protein